VLGGVFDWPSVKAVVGITILVDAFLGVLLYILIPKADDVKHGRIHGGVIKITEIGDKQVFSLELEGDPVMFEENKEVVFRVNVNRVGDE
jgi:hypothetical protein